MSAIKYINRLKRIDRLIRLKATGTPSEFADRIGMSERNLYHHLQMLKELGAPLGYNQTRNSYVYAEGGRLEIRFVCECPENRDPDDICGGQGIFNSTERIMQYEHIFLR